MGSLAGEGWGRRLAGTENGAIEIARLLLDAGADPDVKDGDWAGLEFGWTSLKMGGLHWGRNRPFLTRGQAAATRQFQFQGKRSSRRPAGWPLAMRSSTSRRYAKGSTPLSFAAVSNEATIA